MPDKEEYYSEAYPSPSNFQWLPWLQKQLIIRNIKADTPEMPQAYNPEYEIWKREFERFDITPETLLVGHSCGGGFLLRWLSEHKDIRVGKVVLVAPWLDPDKELPTGFFNFTLDSNLASRTQGLIVLSSDDDWADITESVSNILASVKEVVHVPFHGYGHFISAKLREEGFPELLDLIL